MGLREDFLQYLEEREKTLGTRSTAPPTKQITTTPPRKSPIERVSV